MKTIKIFLASSNELEFERNQITLLISELNRSFKTRGLQLEIERWEWFNSGMSKERKQNEYNNVLKECEMCLALFWHSFGCYTEEEFNIAANRAKEGENPQRVYVYFKNQNDGQEISKELIEFKEDLVKKYNHFSDSFTNEDSLKLKFLLQLEIYQKEIIGENAIDIFNGKVCIDRKPLLDINNVLFAANNQDYQKMLAEYNGFDERIQHQQEVVKIKKEKLNTLKDKVKDLDVGTQRMVLEESENAIEKAEIELQDLFDRKNKLAEDIEKEQRNLFNTARRITEQQGRIISDRMARAIEAFEKGDVRNADYILKEAEHDSKQILDDIKLMKEVAIQSIEELAFKASVRMSNTSIAIEDRIEQTIAIYEQAIALAKEIDLSEKFMELLNKFQNFLMDNGLFRHCIVVLKEKLNYIPKDEILQILKIYINLSICYNEEENYDISLLYNNKAVKLLSNNKYIKDDELVYNLDFNRATIFINSGLTIDSISINKKLLKKKNLSKESALKILCNIGIALHKQGKDQEALEYFRKANDIASAQCLSLEDHARLLYNNSLCYCNEDYVTSIKFCKEALETCKDVMSDYHPLRKTIYFSLGSLYLGNKMYEESLEYTMNSAEHGYPNAMINLGWMYDNGLGVKQDFEKAIEWYSRASEQGNSVAQYNLASMYEEGRGCKSNYIDAYKLYMMSAKAGYMNSQYKVGCMYELGKGVAQDYAKAIDWYTKSAEQGNDEAQCKLGYMYEFGKGVAQDYVKAVEWYTKSAEQGNARGQYNLGDMYEYGKGVAQDYAKAVEWYTKSAEQGNDEAQCELGYMYESGKGVNQNYDKAFELFMKAANQGDSTAEYNIGIMYCEGNGIDQDYDEAIKWEKRAIEHNFELAYNELAWILNLRGKYEEAILWALKAVEICPKDTHSIDTLATVYQNLCLFDKALEQFQLCYKLESEQGRDTSETNNKIKELKKLMNQ